MQQALGNWRCTFYVPREGAAGLTQHAGCSSVEVTAVTSQLWKKLLAHTTEERGGGDSHQQPILL